MTKFEADEVRKLWRPAEGSYGEDNGQVTIIGGSDLFHGAPIFAVKAASRLADMVFFSSPEPSVGEVALKLKARLNSFIWVPWEEVDRYIEKSDAVLIGPGLMRYRQGTNPVEDDASQKTREITKDFLTRFPEKRWVIDAGSLQVMEVGWIPANSILTPNDKEYAGLFGNMDPAEASKKYNCTIVLKGAIDKVCTKGECIKVIGGNTGMKKGGMGDTLAGLAVALLARNDADLAASCASYINKKAGDRLHRKTGPNFNADDLAREVPKILGMLQK